MHNIRLSLESFRSYDTFSATFQDTSAVFIQGRNGCGKTNLLEALSLMAPGRGLRGATSGHFQSLKTKKPWQICLALDTPSGPLKLVTCAKPGGRSVSANDASLQRQTDLSDYLSVLWLTPSMDLLFKESMAQRRRFFDRLFISLDSGYAPLLLRYEKALKHWRALLIQRIPETAWPAHIQNVLTQNGAALMQKRDTLLTQVLTQLNQNTLCDTPVSVTLNNKIQADPALKTTTKDLEAKDLEALFYAKLDDVKNGCLNARSSEAMKSFVHFGPHSTSIEVTYDTKPIYLCSTGEQKMTVVSLLLAAAYAKAHSDPDKPFFLLLDELSSHLDAGRITHITKKLTQKTILTWITGTELSAPLQKMRPDILSLASDKHSENAAQEMKKEAIG